MQGTKENAGIMYRSFNEVFSLVEPLKSHSIINLNVYMVEIYMDNLFDLLSSKENKNIHLEIKEDYKGMTYIHNVTTINVQNQYDLEKIVKIGINNRKTGKTDMNEESSRSHLIVSLTIEILDKEKSLVKLNFLFTYIYKLKINQKTVGKLSLIDLAGSERISKSNPSLKQLNESLKK